MNPSSDVDRSEPAARARVDRTVELGGADARRSADTHLLDRPLPAGSGVDRYLAPHTDIPRQFAATGEWRSAPG